ncbi:MAG: Crp/Fnr family transcriptional regulator [Anaerovoracaceae bacterium]
MKEVFIDEGISRESIEKMKCCFKPQIKGYTAGEVIMQYSDQLEKVAILLSGLATLYCLDADGEYVRLDDYEPKDVFGELFYLPLENFEYIVECIRDCQVVFIDYDRIIAPCCNVCDHHSQLINNLFAMTAKKSQGLSLHLNILSQHTIRRKVLTYLRYVKNSSGNNPFILPITLGALAEYLCVDRSAMMREIRLMKEEEIIKSEKKEFYLL